ncbi:MAG: hypothetical protein MUO40_04905, partial [Anaerolineaceae bacterium]|nr:hypothetical protein [Anaerolineaceae bacterium]
MKSSERQIIADHIFGDLDLPGIGDAWYRKRMTDVHHYSQKCPRNPRPRQKTKLTVTVSDDKLIDKISLWYTTDDWINRKVLNFEKKKLVWETTRWGWIQEWEVTLPVQQKGIMLRYKIGAYCACEDTWIYTDNQADNFSEGTHYSIWFNDVQLPEWSKKAK